VQHFTNDFTIFQYITINGTFIVSFVFLIAGLRTLHCDACVLSFKQDMFSFVFHFNSVSLFPDNQRIHPVIYQCLHRIYFTIVLQGRSGRSDDCICAFSVYCELVLPQACHVIA